MIVIFISQIKYIWKQSNNLFMFLVKALQVVLGFVVYENMEYVITLVYVFMFYSCSHLL